MKLHLVDGNAICDEQNKIWDTDVLSSNDSLDLVWLVEKKRPAEKFCSQSSLRVSGWPMRGATRQKKAVIAISEAGRIHGQERQRANE